MGVQVDINRDDPGAQTVYEGREYEATFTFRVNVAASRKEIIDWLEYEMGGGEIADDHPVNETNISAVNITHLRDQRARWFTDWGPDEGGGLRHGKGRIERDGADAKC